MITDFLPAAALIFVTVLIVPSVVAVITMLKDVGLPPRLSPLVAIVLGIALMIAYAVWGEHRIFVYGLIGLLIGLGACGFYDLRKMGLPAQPDARRAADDEYFAREQAQRELGEGGEG